MAGTHGWWSRTLALGLLGLVGCLEPKVMAPPASPLGPSTLVVEPAEVTVTTGQGAEFKVKALDGSRPTATWEALGGGTVDASGRFTAPTAPGPCEVQAKAFGGRVAKAKVNVVAPPRGPVSAPSPVVAGTQGLRASVPDQPGSRYAWTVTGGTLKGDAHGPAVTFDAGEGPTVVLACQVVNGAGLGLKTSLEVPLVPRVTLAVTPKSAVLTAGATRKFGFTLEGGLTGEVNWSVLEPAGGVVDGAGRYRAPATPGTYRVQVASREDAAVKDVLEVKVVAAPVGPVKGPGKVTALAKDLRASVPDQPGCTYAWTLTGGVITEGGQAQMLRFEAGPGPSLRLSCEITNEAGDSFQATLEVPVSAN